MCAVCVCVGTLNKVMAISAINVDDKTIIATLLVMALALVFVSVLLFILLLLLLWFLLSVPAQKQQEATLQAMATTTKTWITTTTTKTESTIFATTLSTTATPSTVTHNGNSYLRFIDRVKSNSTFPSLFMADSCERVCISCLGGSIG